VAAEEYVRAAVAEAFPGDGVLGEEGGESPSRSGRRWIVDPIDGTRSFAAGVPLYTTLLALEVDGAPALGCIHVPVLGQTLVAARGAGAWEDGRRARVSECDDLAAARLVTSGFEYWRGRPEEVRAGFERLVAAVRYARTWGDGYGYFLVATGRADLMCDPSAASYWDHAPYPVIYAEAGGRFTRFDGSPVVPHATSLATNGRLHGPAMEVLRPRPYWELWRQDDNGNRSLVQRFTGRDEAERELRAYEPRGHEQTYWIEASG
jgi:histidinol-phosphatase